MTASPIWAEPGAVVEVFTSKFCPNCPATEKKLTLIAEENTDLLIVFEHVDYWDRGDDKDPHGLAEATERQYDYSNSVSARPGQVFTPMPLINGQYVAANPLWLNWEKAVAKAKADGALPKLSVEKLGGGGLQVKIPDGKGKDAELMMIGMEPVYPGAKARRATALQQLDVRGRSSVTVPKALTPKASEVLVLLQSVGPEDVRAMAVVK